MRRKDELQPRLRAVALGWVDFLEALGRTADMLGIPPVEELRAVGCRYGVVILNISYIIIHI